MHIPRKYAMQHVIKGNMEGNYKDDYQFCIEEQIFSMICNGGLHSCERTMESVPKMCAR